MRTSWVACGLLLIGLIEPKASAGDAAMTLPRNRIAFPPIGIADEDPTDKIIGFASNDRRMNAAIAEARRTMKLWFEAFRDPKAGQTGFTLKVKFGKPGEHIWLNDIDLTTMPATATVVNRPKLPDMYEGQRVSFTPDMITDWMFIEDGYLVGNHTLRVILSTVPSDERAAIETRLPFKIRD